jgi:hypothetical protein
MKLKQTICAYVYFLMIFRNHNKYQTLYNMKNSVIFGLIIGVLSLIWLFVMRQTGYNLTDSKANPIEYVSILIPLIGLYFGVRQFRDGELKGNMGFLEGLIQAFKILLVGGVLAVFAGIIFINWGNGDSNDTTFQSFSGRIFGALLVGVIEAFAVYLLLTTKSNRVD